MKEFICRILSVQRRKNVSFLYVAGLKIENQIFARQMMIDNKLLNDYDIKIMSIIKGRYVKSQNEKGEDIYKIVEIISIVLSNYNKAFHNNFTNNSLTLRICRNEILNQVKKHLEEEKFQCVNSPFTTPYRGTSIASPLKITGKYVERYCKITHEFSLKKEMTENLCPVYEIGYVARDVYSTMAGSFEYSILEFVSPLHDIDFIMTFIYKFIDIAVNTAKKYNIKYNDLSDIKFVSLDDDECYNSKHFSELKKDNKNVIFANAPVNSPLVKKINNKRTETIWFYNGESIAHGYYDENNYNSLFSFCESQMNILNEKGIKGEYSKDFLSLLEIGIPNSISIGFGLDRFFQIFFGFNNMKDYKNIMCHSGEYK